MNEVRLARAQHRRARRIFHYRHPGDGIKLREPRHAVVGVLHHDEPFARVVVLQRIGAGAAGIEGNAAAVVLLERRGADHLRRAVREPLQERRHRGLEVEANLVGPEHLNLVDEFEKRVAREVIGRVENALEIELHRIRVEFRAVVKLDAFLKREGPGEAVGRNLMALRELRHGLQVLVEGVEAFIEGLRDAARKKVGRLIRVERSEGRTHRNRNSACAGGKRPGSKGKTGGERKNRSGKTHDAFPLFEVRRRSRTIPRAHAALPGRLLCLFIFSLIL